MDRLDLMTKPAVPHVVFGIFNLAWPNIAFWALVIIVFAVATWARDAEFHGIRRRLQEGEDGR